MSTSAARKISSAEVGAIDWGRIAADLDAQGHAVIERLLAAEQCDALVKLYSSADLFRSRVIMSRHGYGRGEYQYFSYPLPDVVAGLRTSIYPHLAPIANRWNELLGSDVRFPADHAEFIERCHAAGQKRPTPLLLQYQTGDYNCLHQDLYGEHAFPLQMAILLSKPHAEFTGGEFVLVEQRPRMQSRPRVISLQQGDAAIFAVNRRSITGSRGNYRVMMRHGVSPLRSGERSTLGIIFHDAQ